MIWVKSKIIRVTFTKLCRRLSRSRCGVEPPKGIVTLLDSLSPVGQNLALLLKQNPYINELRLFDEEQSPVGLAHDLDCIDTKTRARSFSCKSMKDAIKGAEVVISVGGHQAKNGESQKTVFQMNLDSVRMAAIFLAEFNPKAIFCIAKPPVEALVPMVTEEYERAETYNPRKIIGVTTYTSMIINTIVAKHFKRDPTHVLCPVIGGTSPKSIVPVLSQIRPNVESNEKIYATLQADIEHMLKNGDKSGAATAAAVARFINLVLRGLMGDTKSAECAFVAQPGHIGEFLPYMTSIVKLGPTGVVSTHMPKVNQVEARLLRNAAPELFKSILLGQSYLQGGVSSSSVSTKRICDELLKDKMKECTDHTGMQLPNSQ